MGNYYITNIQNYKIIKKNRNIPYLTATNIGNADVTLPMLAIEQDQLFTVNKAWC